MTPNSGHPRGQLIVLEGADGVGKTTQVARLADALREAAVRVAIVREPGATWLGEQIRALLLDAHVAIEPPAEAFLFLAARAQLMVDLRHHLADGTTVVADRFFLSTYAYQIAGRGLPADQVRAANQLAVGGLVPDLTVVLTFAADAARVRKERAGMRPDRIEQSSVDFHSRVVAAFQECLTAEWQQTHPECGPVVGIDAAGTETEVAKRVAAVVAGRWPAIFEGASLPR